MEATMQHRSELTAIDFGGAFVRQFRFLWASRRPLLLAVALLAVLGLAGDPWTQDMKMRLLVVWPVWIWFVPIFWAFAVFHNEGPDNRYYFWAQPTNRTGHTMARVSAGLAWLWIGYAVLILAGWVFGMVDENVWQMAEISSAGWLNLFTGATLVYLLVSILTVPSNYPIRWFFGILFAIPLVVSLLDRWVENLEEKLETVFGFLVNEDWGFFVTTIGAMAKEIGRLDTTLRQSLDPTYQGHVHDIAQNWGVATPVWIIVMVAVVTFIATRHPDTLPTLRRLKFWG